MRKLHKIGDRVSVMEAITDENEQLPAHPWAGEIVRTSSKIVKCRPATVYHVRLESGQEIRAWYRHIFKR